MAETTENEQGPLEQFRAKVEDLIPRLDRDESSDINLVRWLRAQDLNVELAEEMFRKSMTWREENRIDELGKDMDFDEYLIEKMPLRLGGRDKEGILIAVCPYGRWDMQALLTEGLKDRMLQHVLKVIEAYIQHVKSVGNGEAKFSQALTVVFDMDQFSMRQVASQDVIYWIMEFFRTFDANYPETLKSAYVVNVPKIFEIFWPLINIFLSARTLSKVHILGGWPDKWRQPLREIADLREISSDIGGSNTMTPQITLPFSWSLLSLPRAPVYPSEELMTTTVPAGSKLTKGFNLKAGNRITWNFKTDTYDVGFEFTKNQVPVYPSVKSDCYTFVQDGLFDVVEDGTYELVFDNTYSRFRSKTLHYVIKVDDKIISS